MPKKDPRVGEYISNLPAWQQDVCHKVRELIHAADEQIQETIKFTNRPYFVLNGNICALLATKDHVNVFIYDPVAPDPQNIINQGHGNKTARAIQIYQNSQLNEEAMLQLFKDIIKNNRAGGWRHI